MTPMVASSPNINLNALNKFLTNYMRLFEIYGLSGESAIYRLNLTALLSISPRILDTLVIIHCYNNCLCFLTFNLRNRHLASVSRSYATTPTVTGVDLCSP